MKRARQAKNSGLQANWLVALLPCALLCFSGCDKGSPLENREPETYISIESINLTGEDRLNSVITLQWWGTDPDGIVEAYGLSFDQTTWITTDRQDSTFQFSINAGSDTVDIDFWVRAIDEDGAFDQSPAYLKIPLKNTPPEVSYDRELIPSDTVYTVLTLAWEASDLDGIETIDRLELKANDGDWVALSPNLKIVSLVPQDPTTSGSGTADIYLSADEVDGSLPDLRVNDLNSLYLRAVDIAGSVSVVDTLDSLYLAGKANDVLIVGAHSGSPDAFYKDHLNAAGVGYDFIDMVVDDGRNQPKIWNPTFTLLLRQYASVLMYTNDVDFTNAQTGGEDIILEFASTSLQDYSDQGGKLLLSSSFPNAFSTGSALLGILPVDSFSTSQGQARLPIDSLAEGMVSGYPDLVCNAFISGLDPFYPSADATPIYSAQLTKNNGWDGPKIVGARRTNGQGNTNFIFFSVELHRLDKDLQATGELFDHIYQFEFNW